MFYLYILSVILSLSAVWYGLYRVDASERVLLAITLCIISFIPMLNMVVAFSMACIGVANRLYD